MFFDPETLTQLGKKQTKHRSAKSVNIIMRTFKLTAQA